MPHRKGRWEAGFVTVCLASLLLGGCAGGPTASVEGEEFSYTQQPCWLNNPYSHEVKGAIGIAGRYGAPTRELVRLSEYRAIRSVADMLGSTAPSKGELKDDGPYRVGNRKVALAPVWTQGNYHFSYAYIVNANSANWIRQECPQITCKPQSCEPDWLCLDGRDLDYASVVTVSQIAASLPIQYSLFFDNALDQLQAMYGVEVEAYERSSQTIDSSRGVGIRYVEDSALEFVQGPDPQMVLADTCRVGTLYYARVVIMGLNKPNIGDRWAPNWHEQLSSPGEGLEIGAFSGTLSMNLLSHKIMRAVEDALVKIARASNIDISSKQIHVQRGSGGEYYTKVTHSKTEAKVEARVRSVRFISENSMPTVYVLVEKGGRGE